MLIIHHFSYCSYSNLACDYLFSLCMDFMVSLYSLLKSLTSSAYRFDNSNLYPYIHLSFKLSFVRFNLSMLLNLAKTYYDTNLGAYVAILIIISELLYVAVSASYML